MSIKTIAQKTGVSPATVSRVLNNPNYRCSTPGLRDKIWKAAMELNYVPNEAARNLKMGAATKNDKTYYVNVLMTRMIVSVALEYLNSQEPGALDMWASVITKQGRRTIWIP